MTAKKPQRLDVQATPASPIVEEVRRDAETLRARILAEDNANAVQIREAQRVNQAELAAINAEHAEAMAAHDIKAAECRAAFRPEPSPPVRPDTRQLEKHALRLQDALKAHSENEGKAFIRNRREIEAGWQEARPELTEDAAEALAVLERVLGKTADWRRLLLEMRRAVEQVQGRRFVQGGDADRTRQQIDLTDILELARGVDILEPAPRPLSKVQKIPRGEDAADIAAINEHARQVERRDAMGVRWWL